MTKGSKNTTPDSDIGTGDDSLKEPEAPDGGWGWMVLIASFFSSVIVDGVCFAFGIFYLEFLDYFQENKGKTAWIGSVLNGMYMIMGPIAGALSNRFGCRKVALVGSVWSTAAFIISTYSPNVNILILTYGVLGGMGFGLMYLPSIVMVGFYFDRKRALATGIATCGSGIGAFIFAPMCNFLINTYGWKGAQWIVAGVVLNGLVLGALYRPLTERDMEKFIRKWRQKNQVQLEAASTECNDSTDDESSQPPQLVGNLKEYASIVRTAGNGKQSISLEMLNTINQWDDQDQPLMADDIRKRLSKSVEMLAVPGKKTVAGKKLLPTDSWHSLTGLAASVENIQEKTCNGTSNGNVNVKEISPAEKTRSILKDIYMDVRKSIDLTMLKNPVFVIYAFSCILCMAGFFIPFVYLPDTAIGLGYDQRQAAFLLSILGITNTVGRVIAGWISDMSWADSLVINNVALIIGGAATILVPFCKSYELLAVYAAIFGLCISAFVSLRSIILVDLIGLAKLTSAFGIIVLCQGITSFLGAPIAGALFDLTGTYDLSFYGAGTTIALAGIINCPLRRMAKHQDPESHKALSVLEVSSEVDVTGIFW